MGFVLLTHPHPAAVTADRPDSLPLSSDDLAYQAVSAFRHPLKPLDTPVTGMADGRRPVRR